MSDSCPDAPEGKIGELRTGRRIHLDIMPIDRTRDDDVKRLLAIGATEYEDHRKPDGTGWATMADPEGNLFCVERSATERVCHTFPLVNARPRRAGPNPGRDTGLGAWWRSWSRSGG